jgi:hypothetical protein
VCRLCAALARGHNLGVASINYVRSDLLVADTNTRGDLAHLPVDKARQTTFDQTSVGYGGRGFAMRTPSCLGVYPSNRVSTGEGALPSRVTLACALRHLTDYLCDTDRSSK